MKKHQIKVGQKYTNPKFPRTVYLGVGERNDAYPDTFFNKNLIIIDEGINNWGIGQMFQFKGNSPEWTDFIPYNSWVKIP